MNIMAWMLPSDEPRECGWCNAKKNSICLVVALQAALVSSLEPGLRWWLGTKGPQIREEEVYDAWYNLAPACPQLYLYSDADAIVPREEVERYMQVQVGACPQTHVHACLDLLCAAIMYMTCNCSPCQHCWPREKFKLFIFAVCVLCCLNIHNGCVMVLAPSCIVKLRVCAHT